MSERDSSEGSQPEVLVLNAQLGVELMQTLLRMRERAFLDAGACLLAATAAYDEMSQKLNQLAVRILHNVTICSDHRSTAAALATSLLGENTEMLNTILGEMRLRGLTTPEEAHLTLVAALELFGFFARAVADHGSDAEALLRQAIATRNSTLDDLGL